MTRRNSAKIRIKVPIKKSYSITSQKILSFEELDQLERLCRKNLDARDRRDALLILIAIKTGGRASEILNVRVRHFSRYLGTLFLIGMKGSNDREIPLPDFLVREIERYIKIKNLKPDDRIFNFSYHRLYQIWEFYRPVKKKFHSIRHTFAIDVYRKTRDIKLVQMVLGHRSIMNTMVYLDFVYSQDEMRKILI